MLNETTLSERRACRLAGLSRDAFRHPPTIALADLSTFVRLIELAQARRRFGYRRLHDLLGPGFPRVNHKRVYRLYHEANLAVRKRRKAKFPTALRQPLEPAFAPNEVWSMDFVSDALASGRKLRCLTVADDFTHECVDIAVDHGIGGRYVTRILDQAACFRGYPTAVRTDNVLTAESSSDVRAHAAEAVLDVLCTLHPLLPEVARGLPRSRRSPDLTIMNTRSVERPRPYLKQHGVPWKVRTLSTGSYEVPTARQRGIDPRGKLVSK